MDIETAAQLMCVPAREIARVDDSPAGTVIVTVDGVVYINVPVDSPDDAGRTGLMYLAAPNPTYQGTFPVYQAPAGDDVDRVTEPATADAGDSDGEGVSRDVGVDLGVLSKPDLVAKAEALGIEVKRNWSMQRIIEKIQDALNDLVAATDSGDVNSVGDSVPGDAESPDDGDGAGDGDGAE